MLRGGGGILKGRYCETLGSFTNVSSISCINNKYYGNLKGIGCKVM
jgi:hypothetical protein